MAPKQGLVLINNHASFIQIIFIIFLFHNLNKTQYLIDIPIRLKNRSRWSKVRRSKSSFENFPKCIFFAHTEKKILVKTYLDAKSTELCNPTIFKSIVVDVTNMIFKCNVVDVTCPMIIMVIVSPLWLSSIIIT